MKKLLEELNACKDAVEWIGDKTLQEAWEQCDRGDWMLWFAQKLQVDLRILTRAKVECAKLVEHLMEDERSINALRVAESFADGKASINELNTAAAAAYATAAYAYATAAAAAADSTAADAAAYAYATAAYAAADAAYAAADAAYAAYAAADAADSTAAYAAAYAYATAATKETTLKKCADICRKYLTEQVYEKSLHYNRS